MEIFTRRKKQPLTPEYLAFGSKPITKFCGAGYHEGTHENPLLCCDGWVKDAFVGRVRCTCPCHEGDKYAKK